MTSANFAAAQKRVLERRRLREAQTHSEIVNQPQLSHPVQDAFRKLPYPVNRLPTYGIHIWDTLNGREGTAPSFRVGQVDAELLDEELLDLFKRQVGEGLKYFGPHIRDDWSSEVLLALRAALFKLSIWDHNASYGAALQGLRYTDSRKKFPVATPPTKWQKALYGFFTVGGRYAWEKWETWLIDQEGGYEEPSHEIRLLSRITNIVSTTHSIAAFTSFLVFLVNGRYRTLLDRILRIRLAPPSSQTSREVSFEYLNRQLVWHAFTEFLLFLLPLVGIGRWRRWISRAWRKTLSAMKGDSGDGDSFSGKNGQLAFLPERTCAICYHDQNPSSTSEGDVLAITMSSGGVIGSAQTDITNPYESIPCGCIYCFVCISEKIEAETGTGWVCLRCGELVKSCKPWNGDVLEEVRRIPAPGKNVGFAMDTEADMETEIRIESGRHDPFERPETDDSG